MKNHVEPVFEATRAAPQQVSKPAQNLKRPTATVRPELNKIEVAGRPWWAEAPEILQKCLVLIFAPFRFASALMDMLVSTVFLSVFAVIGLWWMGYISDETIANFVETLGNRLLGIIQKSGIL